MERKSEEAEEERQEAGEERQEAEEESDLYLFLLFHLTLLIHVFHLDHGTCCGLVGDVVAF